MCSFIYTYVLGDCRIRQGKIQEAIGFFEKAAEFHSKEDNTITLDDRIFVRHKDKMVKLYLMDICYLVAERSYCRIITLEAEYLISDPLKQLEDKLPKDQFMRVHRSYVVNLKQIDEVAETHIVVFQKVIPISRSYKSEFFQRIRMI
ncbi:MAG: LytTR family DNA-binding domain-containing protein [Bacteroidota bacterium]